MSIPGVPITRDTPEIRIGCPAYRQGMREGIHRRPQLYEKNISVMSLPILKKSG